MNHITDEYHFSRYQTYNQELKQLSCFANLLFGRLGINFASSSLIMNQHSCILSQSRDRGYNTHTKKTHQLFLLLVALFVLAFY